MKSIRINLGVGEWFFLGWLCYNYEIWGAGFVAFVMAAIRSIENAERK